jgi:hypothetical protein
MPAGTNPLAFLAAASSTARKPEVPTDAKANNTVGTGPITAPVCSRQLFGDQGGFVLTGFYAKAVVTLDKEPPRRKGLDTSGMRTRFHWLDVSVCRQESACLLATSGHDAL